MKIFRKAIKFLVIFILLLSWMFNYPPFLYENLGGLRIWQKPAILPGILLALSTTVALLTGVFAFAILKIVNPPRAVFGPCGVLFLI